MCNITCFADLDGARQNIIWVFSLFWYQIYDNFDCSYVFDYTYIILFNLAFTSLPIIFQGILDQDVDDKVALAVPQLYRRGIEQKEWTQTKFWLYMFDGLYQSVICFYFTYSLFSAANFVTEDGRTVNDYKRLGVYIVSPAVVVVNLYILINTSRWDWFMVLITAISILPVSSILLIETHNSPSLVSPLSNLVTSTHPSSSSPPLVVDDTPIHPRK